VWSNVSPRGGCAEEARSRGPGRGGGAQVAVAVVGFGGRADGGPLVSGLGRVASLMGLVVNAVALP